MAWVAVGTAVVGAVMAPSPGQGQSSANQYDPFMAYRSQFAGQVAGGMGDYTNAINNSNTTSLNNATTQQNMASSLNTNLQGLSAPVNVMSQQQQDLASNPSNFLNTAASQAYLGQVQQATGRQAAATGMFSSGNEQLALQNNMLAGSQQLVQNQMGILGQGQTSAANAANLTGSNMTTGYNAITAGFGAGNAAAQQGVSNQSNYLSNLMQLSGAAQNPAAIANAGLGFSGQQLAQQNTNSKTYTQAAGNIIGAFIGQ
jgi:hypothetical protein